MRLLRPRRPTHARARQHPRRSHLHRMRPLGRSPSSWVPVSLQHGRVRDPATDAAARPRGTPTQALTQPGGPRPSSSTRGNTGRPHTSGYLSSPRKPKAIKEGAKKDPAPRRSGRTGWYVQEYKPSMARRPEGPEAHEAPAQGPAGAVPLPHRTRPRTDGLGFTSQVVWGARRSGRAAGDPGSPARSACATSAARPHHRVHHAGRPRWPGFRG